MFKTDFVYPLSDLKVPQFIFKTATKARNCTSSCLYKNLVDKY